MRVVSAAKAPLQVGQVLQELNERRSGPLSYATVQTVMTRLTGKHVLTRSRQGRRDLYRAVASDPASLAVSRPLAEFGDAAIRPFVEQVSQEPGLRAVLRAALSLHP